MFLKSIKFNTDITFDLNRGVSSNKFFKIYTEVEYVDDKTKPIIDKNLRPFDRVKYEKRKVEYKHFNVIKKNFELNFDDITVIVGDNGCGKSTLLNYLKAFQVNEITKIWSNKTDIELFKDYLDNTERKLSFGDRLPEYHIHGGQIHKVALVESLRKSKITLNGEDVYKLFNMQSASNGENTLDFIESIKSIKDSLIILDEPETSLSIKSQIRVAKMLKDISINNQLIIVTHSPLLMNITETVYNFETFETIDTDEYIKSQYR